MKMNDVDDSDDDIDDGDDDSVFDPDVGDETEQSIDAVHVPAREANREKSQAVIDRGHNQVIDSHCTSHCRAGRGRSIWNVPKKTGADVPTLPVAKAKALPVNVHQPQEKPLKSYKIIDPLYYALPFH